MDDLMVFTDGSVNTQTKVGFGAYLFVNNNEVDTEILKKEVKVKQFEQTSSTKLELQTLIWALSELPISDAQISVYTDSQNILSLPGRRHRLERNNYLSKNNKQISNYLLYKEFYAITDKLNCDFIKVSGHMPKYRKKEIDLIFSLVDKASRDALRKLQ